MESNFNQLTRDTSFKIWWLEKKKNFFFVVIRAAADYLYVLIHNAHRTVQSLRASSNIVIFVAACYITVVVKLLQGTPGSRVVGWQILSVPNNILHDFFNGRM